MRRRLAAIALATTAMVTIAFVVPLALAVRSIARERAVAQAREVTQILVPGLALGDERTTQVALSSAASRSTGGVTAVTGDGRVLGAPAGRDPSLDRARSGEAFLRDAPDGMYLYTPVLTRDPAQVAVVRVHIPDAAISSGIAGSWTILGALGVAFVVAAVLVADRLGRSTVAAARDVAGTARQLSSGDLDARVDVDGPPEVADVALALNGLAERIRHLLADEREAAADLSHRLRTPLTALRVDVGELTDPEVRERLTAALDALERQVDQVIRETRRPAEQRRGRVDAGALVAERAAFWEPLAEDQDRDWTVRAPGGAEVDADRQALAAALDAILGNVFAHTPQGTACRVTVEPGAEHVALVVEDDGPGFRTDDVLDRGASGAGSTGLGLDIARRTADAAGGTLTVSRAATGGARVVLELPRA